MAHFVTIETSAAGWASGRPVSQSDFWHFDESIGKAINGDDGGTWSPASAIVIGGSGIQCDGPLTANGDVKVYGTFYAYDEVTLGNSSTADYLTVRAIQSYGGAETHTGDMTLAKTRTIGEATFESACIFNGTETHNGVETHWGTCAFNDNVTFGGDTTTSGAAIFNGACTCNGAVTLGNATGDAIAINGTTNAYGPFTVANGSDRTNVELIAITGVSAIGRGVSDANSLVIITMDGNKNLNLSVSGAGGGARKFVKNADATYDLTVVCGATLETLAVLAPTQSGWFVTKSDASRWY